ncbi:MAG: 3-deoxy-D-manno-octulosonic acid transferase [Gammaproteobacteria bacterium]|nr:3-deoxy-D-manno-octulosonic acid transferase [Gammaproteobacteria bacterium]MYD75858.1 3-deoxy-D-manno-octulosonic acid transferase [Gammaproteobacteria bacterium]MYJ52444.1 3-deoxy-D-manno-octulosonic acid transferase [Gammaproteobacteria bacterium]
MMRIAYSTVLYLLSPILLSKLLARILRDRKYLDRLPQRFGYGFSFPKAAKRDSEAARIWIHAVSVGEVNAAVPLVKRLKARHPRSPIILTTMTPTGAGRVEQALSGDVTHCYLPYDYPGSVRRFLKKARPDVAVFMETEIWPNYVAACAGRKIPVIFANARLSEKSYRGYRSFRRLIGSSLGMVDAIAVQAQMDAGRLLKLGARSETVHVTGNIKFDIVVADETREAALALRSRIGEKRPVWIAGSTHHPEESLVLEAHAGIRNDCPDALLLLVPRHPERSAQVLRLCARHGLKGMLLTQIPHELPGDTDVVIGNTMGQLPMLICASDVAFIGGSLAPVGGHNVLEACAGGVPAVYGPHMFNFQQISDQVLAQGAGLQVMDERELGETVNTLLNDPVMREGYGTEGLRFVEDNRGALERISELVEQHMHRAGDGDTVRQ